MTDTLTIEKEKENKEQNEKETRVSFKDVNEAIKIADDRYMSMMLDKTELSRFSDNQRKPLGVNRHGRSFL